MRPSMISGSGRAASQLCTACRKEAIRSAAATSSRAASSSATTNNTLATKTIRAIAATPKPPSLITPPRRYLSQSHVVATAATSASASHSSSHHTNDQQQSSPAGFTDQPPATQKVLPYYALFPQTLPDGPPPAGPFHIDLRALKREFLRLQAASHPDFHHHAATSSSSSHSSTSSDEQATLRRRQAEKTSALINSAYKTLSSPLLRAQYLLHELHGVDLAADESGAASGEAGSSDPELLMTVLEAREVIEEAQREEDLEELRAVNEGRIREAEETIGEGFREGDLERVKGEAVRLRYWTNIREGVDNWERGKGVVVHH